MRTDLTLTFADGEYHCKLTVEGVLELQEKSNAGYGEIFARVCAGYYVDGKGDPFGFPLDAKFNANDLLHTIRLGLIGGGTSPIDAKKLVDRYCYPAQPMKETWQLAASILYASMEGYEVKSPGVGEMAGSKKKGSRTRKGGSTPEASSPISPQ